jgi:hypothetical protein
MKTVEKKPKTGVRSADWKESIDEVLKQFDSQLKAFGLEVVQIDTGTDQYEWYIEKRA